MAVKHVSDEVTKQLKDQLTCPICYELYKKPKYLPCYHTYCEECLEKLVVQSDITCPECRKTSVVPSEGVKQLPHNFFIEGMVENVVLKHRIGGEEEAKCDHCTRNDPVKAKCLDCGEFLCNHCLEDHKYSKEYQNHNMMPLNEVRSKKEDITIKPKANFLLCQEHDLELKFYCEKCDQLVCENCTTEDHLKHNHDTMKNMATKHRKELDKIMGPVAKMIEELSVACKEVNDMKYEIGAQVDDIDKEIDRYYEELHQRLQQQRDELKKELHEACRQKKKVVTLQLEQMEHTQTELQGIRERYGVIKNGSDQEALLMKKQVVDDVKRISDNYNSLNMHPVESATMKFVPIEEYKTSMPQFGHLSHGDVCPMNCEALGIPEMVSKGEKVEFKVLTKDQSNHLYHKGGSEVVIQAQSSRGDVTPVEVKDNKDGSYSASFVANQVGGIWLLVAIKGQRIKGSPFNVKVHRVYSKVSKPSNIINGDVKIGQPWGIAFGRDGMWAVTDDSKHCVWIFNREDKLVGKFGSMGGGNGKFNRPLGIAFDANNNLYVTEIVNHRVQNFNIDGTYLFKFGTKGSSAGRLMHPLGIVVHHDMVYIAEWGNHRISVFQLGGQFVQIFGLGQLKHPRYIAISSKNQLLVANGGHHCITIFTLDGICVNIIGTQGTGGGQFRNPSGICVDICGFILVADDDNKFVSIFDKDGIFVHCFGRGHFSSPCGIAVNPVGDIYVNDGKIKIFSTQLVTCS